MKNFVSHSLTVEEIFLPPTAIQGWKVIEGGGNEPALKTLSKLSGGIAPDFGSHGALLSWVTDPESVSDPKLCKLTLGIRVNLPLFFNHISETELRATPVGPGIRVNYSDLWEFLECKVRLRSFSD